jgi:hypothetical protein
LFLPIIAYTLATTKLEIRANSFCWVLGWGEGEGGLGGKGGGGGQGGEMNQALYAHMNNKRKRKKKLGVRYGYSLYYSLYFHSLNFSIIKQDLFGF